MTKGLTRVYFVSCAFFRGKGKTVAANAFSLFLLRLVNDSEQCCTEKAHEPFALSYSPTMRLPGHRREISFQTQGNL